MKYFQLAQKYLTFLGFRSTEKSIFNLKLLTMSVFHAVTCALICSFYIREATNFKEYIDVTYAATASIAFNIQFVVIVFEMKNLFTVIVTMDEISESRFKHDESKAMYEATNRQIEKWTEIITFLVVKLTPVCAIVPKVLMCYYLYFIMGLGNDAFELPLQMWLPFDTRSPIVYLIVVTYQFIVAVYTFLFMACVLSIGIGDYLFLLSATVDIKRNLRSFNKCARAQKNQLNMIFKELTDVIQLHSKSKDLIDYHVKIYRPMYAILFTWSLITICISMLMIQIELENLEISAEFLMRIFLVYYAFGLVFVVCELGQRMTNAFDGINNVIGRFNWYLFPDELKRIHPFIIHFAQRPVDIEFFGKISCSREVFRKVLNNAYSYFMVLREFRK